MRHPLLALAAAAITGLVITTAVGASSVHRLADDSPIVLTGDVTPEVRRLVTVVVRAAQERDVAVVPAELEIRFVDRVNPTGFVGGWTDGLGVVVGRNVALPKRTLLHEFAHAVVGVEFGHVEPWRSVYIAAIRDVFGDRMAERELRRIHWVYDKSYLESRRPAGAGRGWS